jgi:hypothetical protein
MLENGKYLLEALVIMVSIALAASLFITQKQQEAAGKNPFRSNWIANIALLSAAVTFLVTWLQVQI